MSDDRSTQPASVVGETKWSRVGGGLVAAIGGIMLLAGWLDGASYDLAYLWKFGKAPAEVVLVEMDASSHTALNQPGSDRWDRRLHARLVERLLAAGAKALAFDIRFDGTTEPEMDQALRSALARSDRVVLGAGLESPSDGALTVVPPAAIFREVAAWGVVEWGRDAGVVRRPVGRLQGLPTLREQVTRVAKGEERSVPRSAWIRYYGPPGSFERRSFAAVLNGDVPAAVFRDRVIFVGANSDAHFSKPGGGDYFLSPYSRFRRAPISGLELNATTYLNHANGDWLGRLPGWMELLLVLGFGTAATKGLERLAEPWALGTSVVGGLVLSMVCTLQVWWTSYWFPWLIPCAIQIPAAWAWTIAWRSRNGDRTAQTSAEIVASPRSTKCVAERTDPYEPRIPDHVLVRCIGRGAYGEVWLARSVLGIHHAAKILRRSNFASSEPLEREFRGLQHYTPISRSHPGLVQILHVGRDDRAGSIYYIMEMADDQAPHAQFDPSTYQARTLASEISSRGRLTVDEVIHIGEPLCDALSFLHDRRLVHRDIKPANILFVEGKPKLADIGLVTEMAATGTEMTQVGTPGYMPPEGPGAPMADVFGLGKVLYVAATGLPADRFPDVPEAIAHSTVDEQLEALFTVLLKACEPIRADRFQSARELGSALNALRNRGV